jgi:hypothetical protein
MKPIKRGYKFREYLLKSTALSSNKTTKVEPEFDRPATENKKETNFSMMMAMAISPVLDFTQLCVIAK